MKLPKALLISSILGASWIGIHSSAFATFEWTPPVEITEQEVETGTKNQEMTPVPKTGKQQTLKSQEQEPSAQVFIEENEAKKLADQAEREDVPEKLTPIVESPAARKMNAVAKRSQTQAPEKKSAKTPLPLIEEEALPVKAQDNAALENAPQTKQNQTQDQAVKRRSAQAPKTEVTQKTEQDLVTGFGEDLTLVMAIRQIVPVSYSYSFGQDVDLSRRVSWEGGQTWQETLKQIAQELDYEVIFGRNSIRIASFEAAPMPSGQSESAQDSADNSAPNAMSGAEISAQAKTGETQNSQQVETSSQARHNRYRENQVIEASLDESLDPVQISRPIPSSGNLKEPVQQEQFVISREVSEEKLEPGLDPLIVKLVDDMEDSTSQPATIDLTGSISPDSENETTSLLPPKRPQSEISTKERGKTKQNTAGNNVQTQGMRPQEMAAKENAQPNTVSNYYELKTWKVANNSDIKKSVSRWAEKVDVDLKWQLDENYYSVGYMVWEGGTFEQAIEILFKGYESQQGSRPTAVSCSQSKKICFIITNKFMS